MYRDYLADLLTFIESSNHLDLDVLADGHGADIVFLLELLGQRGRCDLPAHLRGGIDVAFADFAAVRGHEGVELDGDRPAVRGTRGSTGCSAG